MSKRKPKSTGPRPVCVHCGKPYGSRHVESVPVRWKRGEPFPPYRGNGIVVKEIAWTSASDDPAGPGQNVSYRTVWDGVTWSTPYEPFCKLRCALAYAREAYARTAAGVGALRPSGPRRPGSPP